MLRFFFEILSETQRHFQFSLDLLRKSFWSIILCISESSIVLNILRNIDSIHRYPELIKWKEVNSHTQKLSETIIGPLDHNETILAIVHT